MEDHRGTFEIIVQDIIDGETERLMVRINGLTADDVLDTVRGGAESHIESDLGLLQDSHAIIETNSRALPSFMELLQYVAVMFREARS